MKNIVLLLIIISFQQLYSQKRLFTFSNVLIDSIEIKIKFDVIFQDSIKYPLYSNKSFINFDIKNYNFFNIILEKIDHNSFSFKKYSPNERIEYVLSSSNYEQFALTKEFNIIRTINKFKNTIEEGLYRTKIKIKLKKYNKGYKNYESEFIYFYVKY